MATEPERDIEKTLKAYAEKRREQAGAPLELHPATRRLLQGEAARLSAKPEAQQRSWWWSFLSVVRPRFVSIAVSVVLVGVCTMMFLPSLSKSKSKSSRKMAALTGRSEGFALAEKRKTVNTGDLAYVPEAQAMSRFQARAVEERKKEVLGKDVNGPIGGLKPDHGFSENEALMDKAGSEVAMMPRPSVPAEVTADRSRLEDLDSAKGAAAPPASARAPALTGGVASAAAASGTGGARDFKAARSSDTLAAAPELGREALGVKSNNWGLLAPENAPTPASAGWAESKAALALKEPAMPPGSATQQFTRLQSGAANQNKTDGSGADNAVLNSFRVEQKGDRMRIIDADGSAYSGFVQNADGVAGRQAGYLEQSALTKNLKQQFTNGFKVGEAAKATNAEPAAGQNYFFRVTGVNRSLNQSVLFSGTLATDGRTDNGTQDNNQGNNLKGATGDIPKSGVPGGVSLPWSQTQVRGQALIGGSNVIEINAAPSAR